jgi:hypothetical protein
MEQIPGAGILDERESLVALGSPDFYSVAASAQYSVSLPTSCSALSAMPYQAAQPPAWQTRVGPRYSPCLGPHGVPGFDTPSLDPSSLSSIQMTKHQPPAYKPTHHSYGPILPMPTNKTVPAFGDSWPDSATVHGFNPRSAPDYFGTDSFPQRNLQEEEFYSPLMSSYVSSADMFYPPPETSISMASQVSAPFWSEQYVTWRQS